MLVFDQIRKDDPQLRFLAITVLGGMGVLLAGLWWVQVVSTRYYREKMETQSVRTVRIPAIRGKILDREGRPLAENLPRFNVDLFVEDLSGKYQVAYSNALAQTRRYLNLQLAEKQKQLGRKLATQEKKQFALTRTLIAQLQRQTRYEVTSNLIADLSTRMQQPISFSEKDFQARYDKSLALPFPILTSLKPDQIARFEEQSVEVPGMNLGVQSVRYYPNGTAAAHLLGYLVRNNDSTEGEVAEYNYRLDDYMGVSGIEKLFDKELRGNAGAKSVLVNNLGYRQSETIWSPAEPGQNVVLTVDLDIQKAAEAALGAVRDNIHGALVVMDPRNGDILAMASAPGYNPNHFIQRPSPEIWAAEWERWTNTDLEVQMNHAMQGEYPPGSIFKIVVGLAALEQGVLNPKEIFHSLGYYQIPGSSKRIGDTAKEGDFDFDKALALSSNPYFITQGLKPGVLPRMTALGQRLHFGERTGVVPKQEDRGYFPSQRDIHSSSWHDGNTANLSIGQEKVAITPLQIAVMISAVANGGKVLYPRLVSRVVPYGSDEPSQTFPEGRVRDTLGVSQRSLRIVHEAMEADVSPTGTGREAAVPGLRIAGKTGTAQVEKNGRIDKSAQITWFASFAPVEAPRYVVVAMVVSGASGGTTCAPLAHKVYEAIQLKERKPASKTGTLAEMQ